MKSMFVSLLALMFLAQSALAVSLAPEIIEQLTQSGELPAVVQADREARERGVWQANPDPYRFGLATDIDTLHCLIILVDFSDMPHETGFHAEPAHFDTLLFSQGIRTPGSMFDYYNETSYSQAYLTGQVTSWYRMSQTYAYYVDGQRGFGGYPNNAQRLAEDAVMAADPDIDFSLYDNDNDGRVDALFVVHAGPGYEDTGNLNYIHSHAWSTSYNMNVDGVTVSGYSMEPEETGSHRLVTIGVYCHEFGHVLGLPDLYDYDYDSQGVGGWSVMAGGSWGGGGATPVHFDGWSKYGLGWVAPEAPIMNLDNVQIDAVEFSPDIYQLYSGGAGTYQYFIVENRQRRLFDVSIPASGLLIYHVDESVPNNNDQTHYKVAVEQADGLFDLEHNNGADAGDPWPGMTANRAFDDFSVPNAWYYGGYGPSEVAVANITNSDSIMFADLAVVYSEPLYNLLGITYNDPGGNSNGRPEAGETCDLIFNAINVRAGSNTLLVTVSCDDPNVTLTDTISFFGSMPINTPFTNEMDPMTFSLSTNYPGSLVYFTLTFTALNGNYVQDVIHLATLGTPDLLLIDDDAGSAIDSIYTGALVRIRKAYDIWDVSTQGSPAGQMLGYGNVIWFTGDTRSNAFPSAHVDAMIAYLGSGGHLMVTSQDFVQQLSARNSAEDSILLHEYLKVDYDRLEYDHHPEGAAGSVFDGSVFLTSGAGGGNNQNSQDALFALAGGTAVLNYRSDRPAAVGVVGSYISLTLGFGAEGINPIYPATYDSLHVLLDAAVRYLSHPEAVDDSPARPLEIYLSQNYPNPFNPSTLISFELSRPGVVKLEVYDLLGRLIDRPLDAALAAGAHSIDWDASGRPSGIYFYRLVTPDGSLSRPMTLLK